MKKLLLFIFALFLWTGAWADGLVNHAYGLIPTVLSAATTPDAEHLAYLTDGDFGMPYAETAKSAAFGSTNPTIFYYDLGSEKAIGRISISWTGAHANTYNIYAVNEAPADATAASALTNPIVEATSVTVPAGNNKVISHDFTATSGRFIVFVATAFDYGCTMHEFAIFSSYTPTFTSFEQASGNYIYNAAQMVPLILYDQNGVPYTSAATSITFANATFGYAHNETDHNFTFGADFPQSVDDLQVTADGNTVAKTFGFLKNIPSTDIIPAIDNDASYIIFSAEKNEAHDIWNTYDGECTSQISTFSINDKSARLIKTMNYVGMKNNTLSSSTDMTGLVLDIFVTKAHSAANCHIKAEGINTLNFSSALTKGWNHVVLSNFTPTTLSGLTTNTTLFIRIDDVASDEEVVIYNLYYTKEAASFDPSSVTSITVTAASTSIAERKTTQLTVKDQADNTIEAENITFESSNTSVATVSAEGVVTAIAAGSATITATVTGNNSVHNTVDITVTETSLGFDATSADGNHTVHVTPYHYYGTNNYKLVITSTEDMTGLGGSYWNINGVGGTRVDANTASQTFNLSDDKHTITITTTSDPAPSFYTPLYVLYPGEGTFKKGGDNFAFDWIDVQKVTIGLAEWASFSSAYALDFGKVAEVKAYYATANDGQNISYDTAKKVPAETGLILGGEQGNYDVPVIDAAPALSSTNLLQSTAAGAYTILKADENLVYVFGKIGSDIGFVKGEEDYVIGANKAYLRLTNELAAKGFNFIGLPGSETDGINKVNTLVETGVRYNLAGQRVGNDYKGIVIVNGRKVVIK